MENRFVCLICHREIPDPEAGCPHCKSRRLSPEGASPLMLAAVFVIMALLMATAGYLAAAFHEEEDTRGRAFAERARGLAASGDYEGSIDHYREALAYARDNLDYRLDLAVALYERGRTDEAEAHLNDIVAAEPTLAVPNLELARIAADRGAVDTAAGHYRRAVYGRWPSDAAARRVQTRFELVALLEREGESMQAVAELLELLEEEPDDAEVASRTAWSLLQVGAPARALAVFERLLEQDPSDAVAHSGAGEAELALSHFLSARTHFRAALRLNPSLTHLEARVALCDEIVALDPTIRGLGRVTRYERSRAVLARALTALEACAHIVGDDQMGPSRPLPLAVAAERAAARRLLEDRQAPQTDEATEEQIARAERLWAARVALCPDPAVADEAIARLLGKLAT